MSYLEIYNDTAYDLLDPDREVKDIDDLPKVMVREQEDGNIALQNLRMCGASNEEEALGLVSNLGCKSIVPCCIALKRAGKHVLKKSI